LADQPTRFRHRMGEKVVQRDAEGYADPEWTGVIRDGIWQGDPASGSYQETYWIERDRGDYFPAEEHTCIGDSTLIPSCATRFGRRSERIRYRGRCLPSRQATWKEARPCGRRREEGPARSAAIESGRGSKVPSSMSTRIGASIGSTAGAMRSGWRSCGSGDSRRPLVPEQPHGGMRRSPRIAARYSIQPDRSGLGLTSARGTYSEC